MASEWTFHVIKKFCQSPSLAIIAHWEKLIILFKWRNEKLIPILVGDKCLSFSKSAANFYWTLEDSFRRLLEVVPRVLLLVIKSEASRSGYQSQHFFALCRHHHH